MIAFLLFVILIDNLSSSQIKQFKIKENSPNGTIVGTIPRYSSDYLIRLIDDANGRFVINSLDQLITIDQFRLNYEEQNQYKIRIQFSNQTELIEENVLINIEDINESPYNLQCSNQTGFCTVLDDDFNQTLKFEIKTIHNLENESYFEVICTDDGQPPLSVPTRIKALPDDMTLIFVPIFPLIIPVNDDNNKIDKQARDNIVILYFNDGDKTDRQRRQTNSPPQDIYFNMLHLHVPENCRDFQIANVYVVDEENDNYTCIIYTYNVLANHQPFEIVNGILRTSLCVYNNIYNLDYETVPDYNITVTCNDLIHHFIISKNFTIDVVDINEPPTELTLIPNTLPENSLIGYVVGRFHAVDPDLSSNNQTFEYKILTDPNSMFQIEDDKLILTRDNDVEMCIMQPNLCPHDYEQISSLLIRVYVEDNGEPQASQKFWIQIKLTDQNDPPVNLQLDSNFVKENSPIGTLIGSFSVQDQDIYQTHTYAIINQRPQLANESAFFIEDNILRVAQSPDYELQRFYTITVQATDNGIIPKSTTNDFLIEILDIDELPNIYAFDPNIEGVIPKSTINNLINRKQSIRTVYLSETAYFQSSLGRIVFLMKDRDRDISLNTYNDTNLNELTFSKPICISLTEIPFRLLCTSIITIANPRPLDNANNGDGHLVVTSLMLTSNDETMIFAKPLRFQFESVTLTINGIPTQFIDILKTNSIGHEIGSIDAIELAADGQSIKNVILNPNSSLSYPLEIINSTILKVRDHVNLSLSNLSSRYDVSVLVTIMDGNNQTIEKHLIVNIKDKKDFNLTLSHNKIMENSHENISIGNFILENGIGNYTIDLIDNANGRFKLNGINLLTAQKYILHCHLNRTCPLDHETEPIINITIAVRDPSTNETLRLITLPIEVEDENEPPYNLTLSVKSVPEDTTIDSPIGIIHAMDDDVNQTLIYTTNNPTFTIVDNYLILTSKLNYNQQQFIPVTIRANDNGQPSTFTEQFFIISVTIINRAPTNVTSSTMNIYIPQNMNSTSLIVGQLLITDPDVNENFTITFDKPNFRALRPYTNSYSMILDYQTMVYAQIYNISVMDVDPPSGYDQIDYRVNVTANITDSGNHSIIHVFSVHYMSSSTSNSTIVSTILPTATTTIASLSQALHIRIYETTPPNTPIIRGLLSSSTSNTTFSKLPTCTAVDDQTYSFPINTTNTIQSSFIILLPNNYTLNSTIRPTIILHVQCNIANDTNVNQDIVIDVLPAPPTVQINFNQTKPFYATNNINNDTILGYFYLVELTIIPTNRTYNLSLINNQGIFKLIPNDSLIQVGPYPSDLLELDNPYVNLTIQAIETTPNEPTRIIQTTFSIPIIVNSTLPLITFSQTSIPNDTNTNTIIGNFTIHNLTTSYRLQLIDTHNNGLELNSVTNTLTLKRPVNTLSLINNQTQLPIKVALINKNNQTISTTTFPLTIIYSKIVNPCLDKDCGNGTCISSNDNSSYCLCTSGYTGVDCKTIDACAYNPCTNNGVCHQLSTRGDFSCQCLPNHSGSLCEIPIDVCQLNTSLCPTTDICIPINNNLTKFFACISRDELQYLVFDYLNDYKNIDAVNDENLPKQIEDFIKKNLLNIENIVLPERKILGPYKYDRAELISVGVQTSNNNITTLNNALETFCSNQSLSIDSFSREICSGYRQATYLDAYFKSTPNFCPNCTFTDAADKYYWFDETIPFLPLWITLILGSLLITVIPLIPFGSTAPKKIALPLMKAKMHPEEEEEEEDETPVSIKSVRSAAKLSRYSYRERNDSGYESNENSENYLEQIILNHQQQEPFHVYPVLHQPRSPLLEHRGTTIDDLLSSNNTPRSRSTSSSNIPQRSSSMLTQNPNRRRSSVNNSQTLKPIIHRRSTLFDSSIGTLIGLTGTPRLSHNDETYVSTTFRNENTSKFVIGTLWNTFALVNNLFLQRPRKRRNALTGDTNIQPDQLTYLQQLYSLTQRDQATETSTHNLQSIVTEALLEPQTNRTNHLQSIIFDILSSTKDHQCTCYGNHHVPSCNYYDHSLPYLRHSDRDTSHLQQIFYDILKSNKPHRRDASTQSYVGKPPRLFTHSTSTNNVATQMSPILTLTQLHHHVSTQYSPIGTKHNITTQSNSREIYNDKYNNIDVSTQTIENNFHDISTQFSPQGIENNDRNILIRIEPKTNSYDDHIYVNVSTPEEIQDTEHKPTNTSTQLNSKVIEDDNIHDRQNSLMNELKQVLTSLVPEKQIINKEKLDMKSLPNHTVRSLVSMFETTTLTNKPNLVSPRKSSVQLLTNNSNVLTPPDSTVLNISSEETHLSTVDDIIEQYADEVASNIVDNAVLTATTTPIYYNEQQQRRFSLYNNAGGHGKSLLFQANTFVPSTDIVHQEPDQHFRAESHASSTLIKDPLTSTILNESQHTLIVGRHINGEVSNRSKTKKHRNSTHNINYDSSSLSSTDNEQIHRRLFLSNSQLFSAHELYIRPWLVRRATAPNIHCLDNDISETYIETTDSINTFFNIFPSNSNFDLYTRYTCLITILLYLHDVHDEYSNGILYDELDQIEKQLTNPTFVPPIIHSNVFQTTNLDGSKRYRTGFILDINSSDSTIRTKILAKQIEWKRVKVVTRRFRKKYQRYKQLIKHDKKKNSTQTNIEIYLKYFDSTSKRRMKKYAKHYAEKL